MTAQLHRLPTPADTHPEIAEAQNLRATQQAQHCGVIFGPQLHVGVCLQELGLLADYISVTQGLGLVG